MAGESDKSVPISQLPTAAAILTLAKTIKEDRHLNDVQLPGLANLLAREADPNVDLNDTDFTLQLLKVFRDSDDQTYEGVLNGYTPNERELFDEIVAGKRSLIDAIEQYEPAPSLSARRALRLGQEAQISSDNVPQAPIPETHPIHHLVSNFLHLNHKPELPTLYNDSRDKQQIKVISKAVVMTWNTMGLMLTHPGLCWVKLCKLGSDCGEHPSIHVCATYELWRSANRQIRQTKRYGRSSLWLP